MRLQTIVHRDRYERKLAEYRDSQDIKVITGTQVRQVDTS